jgi:FixJ family two-component response regulator
MKGKSMASEPNEPVVFVIDDDEKSRKSVRALVSSMGARAETFCSAEAFLASIQAGQSGCVVTDVRMPGMDGLELQEQLKQRDIHLPVIVITAYARTSMTVRAVKAGAVTLLEKPYENEDLWDAIREALALDVATRAKREQRDELRQRADQLTESERRVMEMMVQGRANKVIAKRLDVSLRTVESRRREVFRKMQANSLAELVGLVIDAGIDDQTGGEQPDPRAGDDVSNP